MSRIKVGISDFDLWWQRMVCVHCTV